MPAIAPQGLCLRCLLDTAVEPGAPGSSSAEPLTDQLRSAAENSVPPCFGEYELLGELGRGGQGIVYRARHRRLGRTVALKTVPPAHLAGDHAWERFRLEASAAALLDHPNIVPVYEAGEWDGFWFYTMKLVEGGSMQQRFASGLPDGQGCRDAAAVMAKVARAVHHAHQRGILHRDLKPSNVLLDSHLEPHVSDFGLARQAGEDASLTLTQTNAILGTPAFLSPEVIAGGARQATVATDVYGLGGILYQLLTGRPPCSGATVAETLRAVQDVEPARPGTLNRAVPFDLETICLKCLGKEPAKRYATAEAFAEDLERFLRNEPILARPVGAAEKVMRWCRRKPVIAGLLLALQIVFALGVGGIVWQWRRAVAGELNARQHQYAADMNLVKQAWDDGSLKRARARLASYIPRPGEPDLRGFEWRYLWRLCQDESRCSFGDFPSGVRLMLSPDGSFAAAASGNVIQLLDYVNERVLATLHVTNATEDLRAVAFARNDSDVLATVSGRVANLWSIRDRRITSTMTLSDPSVDVALSHDGKLLASVAGHECSIELWDVETRAQRWRCSTPSVVFSVLFAPDGQSLISCGGGERWSYPAVWDLATGEFVPFAGERQGWIEDMCLSPDGKVLAAGSTDNTVRLWDLAERRLLGWLTVPGAGSSVSGVSFSADGRWLAAAYEDSTVRLWDVATRQQKFIYRGHQASVISVAFSPDARRLVSGSWDGTVKVWDLEPASHDEFLARDDNCLISNFSPDNRRLAWTDSKGYLKIWDIPGQVVVGLLPQPAGHSQRAVFSPDGKVLAQQFDERVKLWDATTLKPRGELTNGFRSMSLSFSPDSRILAAAGVSSFLLQGITNRLAFWNLASQERIHKLGRAGPLAAVVSFSPDGRMVAVGYLRGEVRVWDFQSERLLAEFEDQDQRIWALAFSPDNRWLVAGGDNGVVVFYDVRARRAHRPVAPTSTWILALSFTPDGKTLVSAEGDGTIKLWSVAAREVALALRAHRGWVGIGASFSPDGNLLASDGPGEGAVRLWRAAAVNEIPHQRKDTR